MRKQSAGRADDLISVAPELAGVSGCLRVMHTFAQQVGGVNTTPDIKY